MAANKKGWESGMRQVWVLFAAARVLGAGYAANPTAARGKAPWLQAQSSSAAAERTGSTLTAATEWLSGAVDLQGGGKFVLQPGIVCRCGSIIAVASSAVLAGLGAGLCIIVAIVTSSASADGVHRVVDQFGEHTGSR